VDRGRSRHARAANSVENPPKRALPIEHIFSRTDPDMPSNTRTSTHASKESAPKTPVQKKKLTASSRRGSPPSPPGAPVRTTKIANGNGKKALVF